MNKLDNCAWCDLSNEDKRYQLYETEFWSVFLSDEQDYIGRCILVLKRHCGSMSELTEDEWEELRSLVCKTETCLRTVLGATVFNWSCLMNSFYKDSEPDPHLHIHVRPRYGRPVTLNGRVYIDGEFGRHYAVNKSGTIPAEDREEVFSRLREWLYRNRFVRIFDSENISFVKLSEELVKDYLRMINDYENVGRFIGGNRESCTVESEIGWVRRKLKEKAVIFSMIEKKSGDFIGTVEIADIAGGSGELGIAITAGKQDRGFGKEAVKAMTGYAIEELKLKKITLKVYPDNFRAIHVYKECGFREYGRTGKDIYMEYVPI